MVLKKDNVVEKIREMIRAGKLRPGTKLKNGVELAREFNVAHLTMRRALRELELHGDLEVVHGRGTFVSTQPEEKRRILLIRDNENEGYDSPASYYLPDFLTRCSELGVEVAEVLLSFLRNSPPRFIREQLREYQYTGVLLTGANFLGTEPELAVLRELDLPVVIPRGAKKDAEVTGFTVLHSNTRRAWRDGLAYLAEKGLTRVALLLCEDKVYKGTSRDLTFQAHRELLQQFGMDDDDELICISHGTANSQRREEAVKHIRKLMKLPKPPQAFYCYSDFIALYAYQVLYGLGKRVPDDVAVMGFCGYPGGKFLSPPLATVDCDYKTIGKRAAELLCDVNKWFVHNATKPKGKEVVIRHKIMKRASVESWQNCLFE